MPANFLKEEPIMLKIQNISKTFFPGTANEVSALDQVNVTIEEGSFTVIIGTNGSGKSTLLNAIAGSFEPDKGSIQLDGIDITRWSEHKRARMIGRVFQNPFAGTAPDMTVAENMILAMHRGQPRRLTMAINQTVRSEIADRLKALKMGLEERLDNLMGTLSGGQRQAITLLMATWLKPKLLLLDEHTAALDPKSAAKVAELTRQIISRDNLTAIMVTHSMQQTVEMPDRIIMMHKGHIIDDLYGPARKRVRIPDLIGTFERVQKLDLFDETVADLLARQYI
jgi:putative tryptophan/tyrosine transport system ATP-binding protein